MRMSKRCSVYVYVVLVDRFAAYLQQKQTDCSTCDVSRRREAARSIATGTARYDASFWPGSAGTGRPLRVAANTSVACPGMRHSLLGSAGGVPSPPYCGSSLDQMSFH